MGAFISFVDVDAGVFSTVPEGPDHDDNRTKNIPDRYHNTPHQPPLSSPPVLKRITSRDIQVGKIPPRPTQGLM